MRVTWACVQVRCRASASQSGAVPFASGEVYSLQEEVDVPVNLRRVKLVPRLGLFEACSSETAIGERRDQFSQCSAARWSVTESGHAGGGGDDVLDANECMWLGNWMVCHTTRRERGTCVLFYRLTVEAFLPWTGGEKRARMSARQACLFRV